MHKRLAILAALLPFTAACSDYPRDMNGTSKRIAETRTIRVGIEQSLPDQTVADAYLARVAAASSARLEISHGSVERMLAQLEHGDLDLVMGDFADDSPWMDDVAIVEPLTERKEADRTVGLHPVAANGENRWVGLLERQVRVAEGGR